MSIYEPVADPRAIGVDPDRLADVVTRARREVDEGLLPSCQIAVAREGRLALFETFGAARPTTRYVVWSCTKGIVASAVWVLVGEGRLDPAAKVVDVFPEFGDNGKDVVTIEQVLLHTSGFPYAPMHPADAVDRARRIERMASWRLNWEPGTRFEYHPSSAHWVLAELIERASGMDFRDLVEQRVTAPLGLPKLLGVAGDDFAELQVVGDPISGDELFAVLGVRELDLGEVTDENLLRFNQPWVRELGVPGGGAVATAADLALFYQGLLHDPAGIWDPDVLADGTGNIRNTFLDPMTGVPCNRTLGMVVAGADGNAHKRQGAFGRTVSPRAFGHGGAHGQIAWADPETGISVGYCTNGMDRNPLREARRGIAIGSRAAVCAAS